MGKKEEGSFGMKHLPQKRTDILPARETARFWRKREEKRTYLQVGDKVFHEKYKGWGGGLVVETRASDLPGGLCFVRILFQDGKQRIFDNSFDSPTCCYYMGITLLNRVPL